MITSIFWIVPAASVLALAFAWWFFRQMKKESEGTERMAEISTRWWVSSLPFLWWFSP